MSYWVRIAALLVVAIAASACGSDNETSSLAGVYEHPLQGRLTLNADETATLDQAGEITDMQWSVSESTITFTFDDVTQVATLRDGDIVFPPEAFASDDETVFERRDDQGTASVEGGDAAVPRDDPSATAPASTPSTSASEAAPPAEPLQLIERGDCVSLAGERIAQVACDANGAEAEVLRISNAGEPDCPRRANITHTVEVTEADGSVVTYAFCLRRILPRNADGVLTVGSCVKRERKTDTTSDITELPCRQRKQVTHRVIASVRNARNCPARTDVSISKSRRERRQSGRGVWCLAER